MKISAVVYTYNRKELLVKCLEGLLSQTYPIDEIIVVDDVSTDGTEKILKEKFLNITYIRLSRESGGAGAIYTGMKFAYEKGYDWIWIMDDDALPLPNALEELARVITGGQIPMDTVGALVSCRVWPLIELIPLFQKQKLKSLKILILPVIHFPLEI